MNTVVLYARVSTAQQEKQGTIQSQLDALTDYAAEQGLVTAPEHRYIDDGYSGARLERLRDAAWRGELDLVLILAPDRLARHYAYQVCGRRRVGARGLRRPVHQRTIYSGSQGDWARGRYPAC